MFVKLLVFSSKKFEISFSLDLNFLIGKYILYPNQILLFHMLLRVDNKFTTHPQLACM